MRSWSLHSRKKLKYLSSKYNTTKLQVQTSSLLISIRFFWETIKYDLMALFRDMYQQNLATYSLNFRSITHLPKKCDVVKIQDYRPICLLNVSFKILTKVITNRIGLVAEKVIHPSQMTFLTGRKWKGSNKCSLCNNDETIQHLFFICHVVGAFWQIVNIATAIPKPNSRMHILAGWITSIRAKEKHLILVGVAAMFWSIWLCKNDIVFDKKNPWFLWYRSSSEALTSFCFWRLLQKEPHRKEVVQICHTLEVIAMSVYAKNG
jgi:hypothetical protein